MRTEKNSVSMRNLQAIENRNNINQKKEVGNMAEHKNLTYEEKQHIRKRLNSSIRGTENIAIWLDRIMLEEMQKRMPDVFSDIVLIAFDELYESTIQ